MWGYIPHEKCKKLDKKSQKYIFVGYSEKSKAYRLLDPVTHNISILCDVIFDEEESSSTSTYVELPIENFLTNTYLVDPSEK